MDILCDQTMSLAEPLELRLRRGAYQDQAKLALRTVDHHAIMWCDSELLQRGSLEFRSRKRELGQRRPQLKQRSRRHRANNLIIRCHHHGIQQGWLCITAPLDRAIIAMLPPYQMRASASQDREGDVVRGVRFRECLL